jgi:Kef-type K+ transport system membrane component KefB
MNKFRNTWFYIGTIGIFASLIYLIVVFGHRLEMGRRIVLPENVQSQWSEFLSSLQENLHHPLAILLAQIITIIIVARVFGYLFRKIKQPAVIGEIVAGIVLGPSLAGMYFPEFFGTLFPAESLDNLQFLSQIGLILFMFVVGMELDLNILKNKAQDAVVISHTSIIMPFTLGMALAYFIYDSFAPEGVRFTSFTLFLGIAMSITAFPVLARIVQEQGMHKTKLGTIVITCAAADDITAWCLLAVVIAIVKAGSFVSALFVIALAVVYVVVMIKVIRPFLARIGTLHNSRENMSKPIVALFFLILILSAYSTEVIGIHALFGAFMAGAVMPDDSKFRSVFIEKVEDVALVLLLPLFFVYTGLRTEIGLLNDPYLWKITLLIIAVAVTGKFVGSTVAAKFVGQSWKESLTIGSLMNTRGLMELVVLNIGYDLGVLTPEIFAMMVIMALVTTFMTGPAIDLINRIFKERTAPAVSYPEHYNILISFGNPERGRSLLRMAHTLTDTEDSIITAMHLVPAGHVNQHNTLQVERESFLPIKDESKNLKVNISTLFKVSANIDADILKEANSGSYQMLLIGIGHSIYEGSWLGKIAGIGSYIINPHRIITRLLRKDHQHDIPKLDDRTRLILAKAKIAVGILISANKTISDEILVPVWTDDDLKIVDMLARTQDRSNQHITIAIPDSEKADIGFKQRVEEIAKVKQYTLLSIEGNTLPVDIQNRPHLLVIGIERWKRISEPDQGWLGNSQSLLVIKDTHHIAKAKKTLSTTQNKDI